MSVNNTIHQLSFGVKQYVFEDFLDDSLFYFGKSDCFFSDELVF